MQQESTRATTSTAIAGPDAPGSAIDPIGRRETTSHRLRIARAECALATLLIVAWLAATAWARPLMLPDEGRYVGVAREMLRSGDWLTPTLNGLPFFHKPPLFYWITAASMRVFGEHEWAARAAPILGAALGACALFWFAQRWSGARAARLTLLALAAQPLFYLGGQFANLDMLVAGCIAASTLLFADAALRIDHALAYRRSLLAAYAAAALGVLAKGLIGAVIPALIVFVWLATMQRWKTLRTLVSLRGTALFLVLAAPWFVAVQARFPGFFDYFFVVQHFRRFATGGFNNVQPFWFYPAVLLAFSLPGWPWLYRSLRRELAPLAVPREPIRRLMWLWVAVVVVFFSIPQSKPLGYVLAAVPPLGFLIADGWCSLGAPSVRWRRLWWAGLALGAMLSVATVAVFAVHPRHSSREIASALREHMRSGDAVFMLGHDYYDLPFYARLQDPVGIVDDWSNPQMAAHDDWRKAIADAAAFAPARSASVLVTIPRFAAALCASATSWVIGETRDAPAYAALANANARAVFTAGGTTLWRVDAAASPTARSLDCATPAAGGSAPLP